MFLPTFTNIPFGVKENFSGYSDMSRPESRSGMSNPDNRMDSSESESESGCPSPMSTSLNSSPSGKLTPVILTTLSEKKRKREEENCSTATSSVSRRLFIRMSFNALKDALKSGISKNIKQELLLISNHSNQCEIVSSAAVDLVTILLPYIEDEVVFDFMKNYILTYLIGCKENCLRMKVLSLIWLQCQKGQAVQGAKRVESSHHRPNLFHLLGFGLLSNSSDPTWVEDLADSGLVVDIFQSSLWLPMLQYTLGMNDTSSLVDTRPSESEQKESSDLLLLQLRNPAMTVCSSDVRFFILEGLKSVYQAFQVCVENSKQLSKQQKMLETFVSALKSACELRDANNLSTDTLQASIDKILTAYGLTLQDVAQTWKIELFTRKTKPYNHKIQNQIVMVINGELSVRVGNSDAMVRSRQYTFIPEGTVLMPPRSAAQRVRFLVLDVPGFDPTKKCGGKLLPTSITTVEVEQISSLFEYYEVKQAKLASRIAKNMHTFDHELKSLASLTKEIVDNSSFSSFAPLFFDALRNILPVELINDLDFMHLIEEHSEDFLDVLESLPVTHVPRCSFRKNEVIDRLAQLPITMTTHDLWRLNLRASTTSALYSLYKKLSSEHRTIFLYFLLQSNAPLLLGFLIQECTSEDFIQIYGRLSEEGRDQLLTLLLKGVGEVFIRCSSFGSETSDHHDRHEKDKRSREYTEFTESFRISELFLVRAVSPGSAMFSDQALQAGIAKVLARHSTKCLLKFFAKVPVGNPCSASYFNLLFSQVLGTENMQEPDRMQKPEGMQELDRMQEFAADAFQELNAFQAQRTKRRSSKPLQRNDHLITQIIFRSHKQTCQRLLKQFEDKIDHMERINESVSIPYTFYVFERLIRCYLDASVDPDWLFNTYEEIESSLIQNISSDIREDFLNHLAEQRDDVIQAFLTWRNIRMFKKTKFPQSNWLPQVAIYLDIILSNEQAEKHFLGVIFQNRPEYAESILGLSFSQKREASYKQLVDYFIPNEILNMIIEKLSHSKSPAQKRFRYWLEGYKTNLVKSLSGSSISS